jgi:hypothetical protein
VAADAGGTQAAESSAAAMQERKMYAFMSQARKLNGHEMTVFGAREPS